MNRWSILPIPIVLGALFQLLERRQIAASLRAQAQLPAPDPLDRDRGSAVVLTLASQGGGALGVLFAVLAPAGADVIFAPAVAWAGAVVALAGLLLRVSAFRALGAWFTRDVTTRHEQPIVDVGPYRYVRHPGYTGFFLVGLGMGLACRSLGALLLFTVPTAFALAYRVSVEERALRSSGARGTAYAAYAERRKRFVPLLF